MKKRICIALIFVVLFFCFSNRQGITLFSYKCQKEGFQNVAQQVLEQEDDVGAPHPLGVIEVSYCDYHTPIVEFLFGCRGIGSATSYWGINYVPGGELVGYQGSRMENWRPERNGTLFYETEGDNTCYVEPLGEGWYYFEADF